MVVVGACSADLLNAEAPRQQPAGNPMAERGAQDYEQRQRDCWDMPNAQACYEVGLNYELGLTTAPDRAKAGEYYKKACDMDHDAEHCAAAKRMGVSPAR
jgi:TPR repeat protein